MTSPKKLSTSALLLIILSATIIMGTAVISQIGQTLKDPTQVTEEAFTSIPDTYVSLANDEIQESYDVTVGNSTDGLLGSGNYTIDYNAGKINVSGLSAVYNITYTYLADTTESNTAVAFNAGLIIFGTFLGILVLSFIGSYVIQIFKK